MPQFPGGAIHNLLGGSDAVDRDYESLHDAKVITDDLGQGGGMQKAWMTTFRELTDFQDSRPSQTWGHQPAGQRRLSWRPLQVSSAFSGS